MEYGVPNIAVVVHIAMIDASDEFHLGRLKWIILWELDIQEKYTVFVRRVTSNLNGELGNHFQINRGLYLLAKVVKAFTTLALKVLC
jgi:hypothetical protein